MKRLTTVAAGLVIGAAALQLSSVASGQSDGWITLVVAFAPLVAFLSRALSLRF